MQAEKTEIGASPEASFLPERVIAFMEGIDGTPCAPFFHFRVIPRGLEEAFLFSGALRDRPEHLLFAPQHSPIAAPAIKLSRVRVYDQG
jgi:hypothetical protein